MEPFWEGLGEGFGSQNGGFLGSTTDVARHERGSGNKQARLRPTLATKEVGLRGDPGATRERLGSDPGATQARPRLYDEC